MERQAVSSSNLTSVGYDPEHKVLEVEFQGGSVYHYLDVEAGDYAAFGYVDSPGRYLNVFIKPSHEVVKGEFSPEEEPGDDAEEDTPGEGAEEEADEDADDDGAT